MENNNAEKLKCNFCDKELNRRYLKHHVEATHNNGEKPFLCADCGKEFAVKRYLSKHHKIMHGADIDATEQGFSCEKCDFKSVHPTSLNRHLNEIHVYQDRYKCDRCEFASARPESLTTHKERRHEQQYYPFKFSCVQCPFECRENVHLVNHVKEKHTEKPVFDCERCSFYTREEFNLKMHVAFAHK